MQTESSRHEPIMKLSFRWESTTQSKLLPAVSGALERVLLFDQLSALYERALHLEDSRAFHEKLLEELGVHYEVSLSDLARIPRTGPVVVTANHPFGAVEGIILVAVLRSVRPDVKVMANFLLGSIPELRDLFILVDPFARQTSTHANVRGLREALTWLKQGGMLAAFPAGEVSHIDLPTRTVTDPQWNDSIARIIRATGASALPVYFSGANGLAFQVLGLVHPRLRTALLPHEFLNKRDKTIGLRIGSPITSDRLAAFKPGRESIQYLRHRTYALATNNAPSQEPLHRLWPHRLPKTTQAPIAPAIPGPMLTEEIESLPSAPRLVASGELVAYYARAGQIPLTLEEIGRLREGTFRAVGEGTGKSRDLDEFDSSYIHLFLWNPSAAELVGAYRLGPTDEILPASGFEGLYTSTLFEFAAGFQEQISCALEMGRSFVRPEYQRRLGALPMLWKGIANFVFKNPRYRVLFGAVSISDRYQPLSQQLMVSFLRSHYGLSSLSGSVKPRTPFRPSKDRTLPRQTLELIGNNLDELSTIISDIESDCTGIPILIKHYLKLGGKVLGFNVDPSFSNVLDALVLVDLAQTDPKILARYMGRDQAIEYLAFHRTADLVVA